MKKMLFWLCLLPVLLPAQTQHGLFSLTGDIKGLPDHALVSLVDANNLGDTITKAKVKAGHFVLKGSLSEPNMYVLVLGATDKKVPLFMGNDQVKVSGSLSDLHGIVVTGSSANDDFVAFQKKFNPYFIRLNSLGQLANSPAGAGKGDSIARVYASQVEIIQKDLDQFIAEKKASYATPFIMVLVNSLSDDVFLLERRYNMLTPLVQNGYYGKYLKEQIDAGKIGAVGTEAIDFTQTDTTGKPVTLSSFRGKYVLVDFWASWCHPCRLENPNVVATYAKFKDKNFTVLGVSLDRSRDPWIKAIHDDNLAWEQVSDLKYWNNEVAMKYKISSIPQNFLIDPNGKIVGRNLRGPSLEAKLCELLGCN